MGFRLHTKCRLTLDGSKVKANASKHKAMSYDRRVEQEKAIRQPVKAMLAQAEAMDAEEDGGSGKECAGDELPEELQRRETRLKRIREAKRALEARARERAKKQGPPAEEAEKAKPEAQGQDNFTDPALVKNLVSGSVMVPRFRIGGERWR
jgi:hypothetical protein